MVDFFRKAKKMRVRVAGIIENENGEILFIQQKKKNKEYWLLPGGGIEFGESAEEALARELKEELNLDTNDSKFLFFSESIDPNGKKHLIQIVFYVRVESYKAEIKDKALVDFAFLSHDKILTLEIRPAITEFFEEIEGKRIETLVIPDSLRFLKSRW
ncbi:MAG: NUDIX hydrolase, partial [Leptospiraceae bacterium]|nr:NUDIX hydrolase [Leptospiraceae bacterium]